MNPKFYFSLIISIINATLLLAYDYPVKPFNKQHAIIATLGESRGDRFHNGVDIWPKTQVPSDSFWLVYSLRSDTILRYSPPDTINNGVYDNDSIFWYLHIYNRIDSGAFVTAFVDTIGRIYASKNHCHFIERDASTLQFINPLRTEGLYPFIDSVSPIIESVSFKLQGPGTQLDKNSLNDTVDIVVRVYDPRIDTTGGNGRRGMGIYKIQYQILDTLKNPVPGATNSYQFDSLPLNDVYARYSLVYFDSTDWNNGIFYYWITNAPFSDTANQYWNTKQHFNRQWYEPPAESIEVAKFKDGYYYVKIKSWDICRPTTNPCDSETVRVHVDNFPPKVKKVDPSNWYSFVPTKKHRVWCTFSEAMDAATLNTTTIKIHSLKSDSFNYPITGITYVPDSFKLYLEVDSFHYQDSVQVRLLKGVKDLAGKSIQGTKADTVTYSWNFIVGVIQLTDNEVNDRSPDVYHGNITWIRSQIGNDYGEIMLYDFYQGTTNQISSGNDSNFSPVIWKNRVAWRRRSSNYFRSIYYYNGSVTQQLAQAVRGRYSLDIDSTGIVWRSCKQVSSSYDTIRIEFYPFVSGQTITLDSFIESYGRAYGQVDISGDKIVWEHSYNTYSYKNDIYLYDGYNTTNITNTPDSSNREPVVSDGQVAWKRNANETSRPSSIWFYDGENNRRINEAEWCYQPKIDKGKVLWYRCYPSNQYSLHYYTGRKDTIIDQATCYYDYYYSSGIHNNQAVWTRYINSMVSNATSYEGNAIINLVNDPTSNTTRIEVHDGFIVYDAWDGHDYEVYLYLSDTLFTPPAVVKNLKGELLGGKFPARKVKLTWKANTEPDLSGYKIYRSATSYQYGTTPYGTVLAPETTFTDTLPFEGMNYYVATAYDNLNNESGFSNQASAFIDNIPPAVPTNLVASHDSINQRVSLIWHSSPDADLKLYKIYRSETSGNYTTPIDSAFKPDTTFIDSTINLGKSYYYVVSALDTNKNESGFSNEDTVIVPFFVASDFALTTAYNNGRKIVSNPTGGTVHFVYAQEGWLADAGIYYSYSVDSSKSFTSSEFVGGPGMYPALAIDTAGNPCASWVSGSNIYYTHWIASWAPPDTIVLPVVNVSPPSMVVDGTDTVHLVFVKYYVLPSDIGDLVYLKFSRTNFAGAVSETLLTNNFCRTPSLAIGPSRNLHILWQGEQCLCYQKKDSTGWLSRDTIYRTTTNEKLYPVIDLYGTTINTAWQDKDTLGNIDIYSRIKTDVGWDLVKKVASTTGESKFPTLSGAHYCLWQDNSSGNWETYKSEYIDTLGNWIMPENISNTITGSVYPHSAYSLVNPTSAKLYCLWTEGDTIPYTVKFKKLDVSPVAKIYVDLGQSAQSPYCLKRDGSWTFGEKPFQTVDWAFDKLNYKFTGLNPQMEYRLDLSFYFENTRINIENALTVIKDEHRDVKYDKDDGIKGIGRIIQALMVDGITLDTTFVKPNKLVRISIYLPKETYADSEIIIDISKIRGKVVVCGEIALYEYPSLLTEILSGGPQQSRTDPIGINISFNIFPNPARRNLNIELRATDNGILMNSRLRMKIFDITGRLVKQFDELNAQHKLDQIIWDGRDDAGKNLSAGVYFVQLEVGDYKQVKKAILLR
jgi:hypothetical protein